MTTTTDGPVTDLPRNATRLNQIVAIERGVKKHLETVITEAYHRIQRAGALQGLIRTYRPLTEDGVQLPDERTEVQVRVDDEIKTIRDALGRLLDVHFTKDVANTETKADVVVGGVTILADVPVTFLLTLEKQLGDMRAVITKLPTLDVAEHWTYDPDTRSYVADPTKTLRTVKIPMNHILSPATDKHPAQVQIFQVDQPQGEWTIRKYSGSIPGAEKKLYLDRLEALLAAVRVARESANMHDITDHSARPIAEYLFAPIG